MLYFNYKNEDMIEKKQKTPVSCSSQGSMYFAEKVYNYESTLTVNIAYAIFKLAYRVNYIKK